MTNIVKCQTGIGGDFGGIAARKIFQRLAFRGNIIFGFIDRHNMNIYVIARHQIRQNLRQQMTVRVINLQKEIDFMAGATYRLCTS